MKKVFALVLALCMVFTMAACSTKEKTENPDEKVEITVFAAASLTETLNQIAELYKDVAPNVKLTFTFDSSGTLKKQIQSGAECDLFIAASQKPMDQLDASRDETKNPDRLDFVDTDTRIDLLENKVVLAVPDGNPKNIKSFDELAELLKNGDVLLAIGNSDVPVGQYTQKIFKYYGLDEEALAPKLTYCSNVKEVTTQVSEAAVSCGIIYATDAYSHKLTAVDSATADMCGRAIYPAAVMKGSKHAAETKAFLDFLRSDAAAKVFEGVSFSMVK